MVFGTGCSFLVRQGPTDLRFVQVNLVNFGGTTSGTTTPLGPKVLVVTLATDRDLAADFDKTRAFPHVDARICSRDSAVVRIYAGIPGFRGLDPYEYAPKVREGDDAARRAAAKVIYLYHIWFHYKSDRSIDEYAAYNLIEDPQDVCITVEGDPMLEMGVGVSTNKVVVPRDAIAAALKAAQP